MQFKRGFSILGFAMIIAMAAGCKSYTEKAAEGLAVQTKMATKRLFACWRFSN